MLNRTLRGLCAVSLVWIAPVTTVGQPVPSSTCAEPPGAEVRPAPPNPADRTRPSCPPFMGLTPPGRTPEVFASELFASQRQHLHGALVVSPDGTRICWAELPPAVRCIQCEDGKWTGPRTLPLPGRGVQAPSFTPDGSRLHFQAVAPNGHGSLDIWWVDARRGDWSHAENVGTPVNGSGAEGQATVTETGEIFFLGTMDGAAYGRGIFHSVRAHGAYHPPRALGNGINTPGIDFYPFVSTDGRTLLFASNRGHEGERLFLHATFRGPDGEWTEPVNLHPLMDFPYTARFPSLSPDSRILFFLSGGKFWWVDAGVLLEGGLR